jgi:hypothetical protein
MPPRSVSISWHFLGCSRQTTLHQVRLKGGMTAWVHWRLGAACCSATAVAADSRPAASRLARWPPRTCARVTGRARLCYRWGAEAFEQSTCRLAHADARATELEGLQGWTLHQLRNSMLADDIAGLGMDVSIPSWWRQLRERRACHVRPTAALSRHNQLFRRVSTQGGRQSATRAERRLGARDVPGARPRRACGRRRPGVPPECSRYDAV